MLNRPKTDLTADFVKTLLDYDPLTGILRWRFRADMPRKWNSKHAGKPAGCSVRGYIQIRIANSGCHGAHRLAWLITHGGWPPQIMDHINGNPSDNRIENLRPASYAGNSANKKRQSNNSSGFVGVRFRPHHNKWEGRINKDGKTVWREYFASAQEAGAARREALNRIHGEFARPDH